MAIVERSALVAYSAQQMFDLINDIESYPLFLDGCVAAEVIAREESSVEARLTLGMSGMQQSFVTRNELLPPEQMIMRLIEGPFIQFEGCWSFKPLDENACKVSLELEFVFNNPILDMSAGKLLKTIANRQVDSLCLRAEHVYST